PANIDYIIGYIFQGGELNHIRLDEVLSESVEFSNWKRDRAKEYVGKFEFDIAEKLLIGLLTRYRGLPAEPLARFMHARNMDAAQLGAALGRLFDLNIVDIDGGEYRLIRPLRDALERDVRFAIGAQDSDEFAKLLVENLNS